ncbi:MAG: imidazole glycerol phosphate synthase subunit HisH [Chthoniobacterales bacterium]
MIGVVDYGSGNLRSVCKALEAVEAKVSLVNGPDALSSVQALVVPGVGAFGDCARNLQKCGMWDAIKSWLKDGKPYLGICLGYQLLFESSEEEEGVSGLGHFKGSVKRFKDTGLKIPHMGWNTLKIEKSEGGLYREIPDQSPVYFVHSYYPVPEDSSIVTARTVYGDDFAASVASGNVHAVQYHPEKSQALGLAILRNFVSQI